MPSNKDTVAEPDSLRKGKRLYAPHGDGRRRGVVLDRLVLNPSPSGATRLPVSNERREGGRDTLPRDCG